MYIKQPYMFEQHIIQLSTIISRATMFMGCTTNDNKRIKYCYWTVHLWFKPAFVAWLTSTIYIKHYYLFTNI